MKKFTYLVLALALFSSPAVLVQAVETGTANQVMRIPPGGGLGKYGKINLASPAAVVSPLPSVNGALGIDASASTGLAKFASGTGSVSALVNADVDAAAGIVDTKLATISTAGKVSNSATTATASNTNSTIMARDGSGQVAATTFTGALAGNATTATSATTATNATNASTVASTTNASFFPLFAASSTNGNQPFNLGAGLTFNPSTNNLSTTTFTGALSGNATTATTATNATNMATVSTSTNASYYPIFAASSSNGNQAHNLGTGLTFNPSTNNLSTTTFTGALAGNATTATSATSATTATNATNVATTASTTNASFFPLFVASSSNGNQASTLGTGLTFNPSTNNLSTTTFTGALSGNSTTATTATNATNAATVSTSTNASFYPLFVASSSNGNQAHNLGTGLTFNPSTNNLSTTTFTGALAGNATTATAFSANPSACPAGQYVTDIDANGTLTCAALTGSTYSVVAGETLAAGDAVYVSIGASDGSRTSGRAYKLDATNANRIEFAGLVQTGGAAAATVTIQVAGEVTGLSGMTLGAPVFASVTTPGALQVTAPSTIGQYIIQLGTAKSTSALVLNGAGSATATLITAPGGGLIAPTIQKFTSGSGTYTKPANVMYIKVRMVGGGGGGGGGGTASMGTGGTGGTTTFGTTLLSAVGGTGGSNAGGTGAGGAGGTASLGTGPIGTAIQGGYGTAGIVEVATSTIYPTGGMGANTPFGGAGYGSSTNSTGGSAIANTGSGGGGGSSVFNQANNYAGHGGGAGGYIDAIINNPLSTYAYAVGAGGTAGTAGTNGNGGGAGGSGYIEVTEYYANAATGTATNISAIATAGSIPFSVTNSLSENNSKLFWDNTNYRLGVGTASPAKDISVGDGTSVHSIQVNAGASSTNDGGFLSIAQGGTAKFYFGQQPAFVGGTNYQDLAIGNYATSGVTNIQLGGTTKLSVTSANGTAITGTTTNDSAATGVVGEYVSVNSPTGGSATPGADATPTNLASMSLTAGDWDCSGTVEPAVAGAATITGLTGGISTGSASEQNTAGGYMKINFDSGKLPITTQWYPIGNRRLSLSATTTVYLVAMFRYSALGTTTWGTGSFMGCRRAR